MHTQHLSLAVVSSEHRSTNAYVSCSEVIAKFILACTPLTCIMADLPTPTANHPSTHVSSAFLNEVATVSLN